MKSMPHAVSLGQRFRTVREALGLSVREVARQAGVSATMLSRVETADSAIKAETVVKLAEVLVLDPDECLVLVAKWPPDLMPKLRLRPLDKAVREVKRLRRRLS